MRYIAVVRTPDSKIKRLMIHECDDDVFLFEYPYLKDGPASSDLWFKELEAAIIHCEKNYRVSSKDWEEIPDPLEYCQQDWIAPVRVIGRASGNPQWGHFEKLIGDEWVEIEVSL